jgi:hypothetical protein
MRYLSDATCHIYLRTVLPSTCLASRFTFFKERKPEGIFLSLQYAAAELVKYKIRCADSIQQNEEKYAPSY